MAKAIYKNNLKTKEEFANAFKELAKKKPMNKISISDLISYCHVNRNTFYYHFEDIYALIEWIIENELTPITNSFETKNFKEFLSVVFDYVENNRHLLSSAYSAFGREKLRKELQPYFHETFNFYISQEINKHNIKADNSFIEFLIDFYSESVASFIIDYFMENKNIGKDNIINNIMILNKMILDVAIKKSKDSSDVD